MIIVPVDTPGFRVERMLSVFGYDEAPIGHAEVVLENVRVPAENLIAGEGRGFEIAQGRLGPGRIHHCMRTIGCAEAALELMCKRLLDRRAFGKAIAEHSVWEQRVAEARTNIEMCRLLVLKAAWMMDRVGAKGARSEIAQIKVAAPRMALKVIDDAIQAHGGAGVSGDFELAQMYAKVRTLRIADGPDEVHNRSIARLEYGWHGGRACAETQKARANPGLPSSAPADHFLRSSRPVPPSATSPTAGLSVGFCGSPEAWARRLRHSSKSWLNFCRRSSRHDW